MGVCMILMLYGVLIAVLVECCVVPFSKEKLLAFRLLAFDVYDPGHVIGRLLLPQYQFSTDSADR